MSDLVAMTGTDDSISNSLSHSSICFDSSNVVSSLHSQIADQEQQADWIPWTNEKHNLYLDSLEMSFVNELRHSVYSYNWFVRDKSYGTTLDCHNYPRQIKVVQDGQWQNIKFKKNEVLTESTADSPFILNNTRVHHSLSSAKLPIMATTGLLGECSEERCMRGNLTASYASTRNSQHLPSAKFSSRGYVSSTEEVSDQNFEDVESDKRWQPIGMLYAEQEWFNTFRLKEKGVDLVLLKKFSGKLVFSTESLWDLMQKKRGNPTKLLLQCEENFNISSKMLVKASNLTGELRSSRVADIIDN